MASHHTPRATRRTHFTASHFIPRAARLTHFTASQVVGASALLADLPVVAARAMDAFVRIAAGMLPECGGGYVVEVSRLRLLGRFGLPWQSC